jgi:hypothetical protein
VGLCARMQRTYEQVEASAILVASATDTDLTIDTCYIPAQSPEDDGTTQARKLLVLSSGVHGVEGYVGSAMQQLFVQEMIEQQDLSSMGVLMIHAINPWGFRHDRRVSENNVDMNRNFDVSTELFATQNPEYDKIYDFLNPEGEVNLSILGNIFSPMKMLYLAARYGQSTLRQAILQGQYKHEKGLYFGGKDFEPQKADLEALLLARSADYDRVFVMDLHTGYGERGRLHLFGSKPEDPGTRAAMEAIFDGYVVDTGDSEDFYTVYGDFPVYVGKLLGADTTYVPMTLEYGTLDSQTTLGSIKSLQRMRLENQGYHYGYSSDEDRRKVQEWFMEMYNPSEEAYRDQIMRQTAVMLPVFIQRFAELEL